MQHKATVSFGTVVRIARGGEGRLTSGVMVEWDGHKVVSRYIRPEEVDDVRPPPHTRPGYVDRTILRAMSGRHGYTPAALTREHLVGGTRVCGSGRYHMLRPQARTGHLLRLSRCSGYIGGGQCAADLAIPLLLQDAGA